jgi:hypothetical protein
MAVEERGDQSTIDQARGLLVPAIKYVAAKSKIKHRLVVGPDADKLVKQSGTSCQ